MGHEKFLIKIMLIVISDLYTMINIIRHYQKCRNRNDKLKKNF